MLCVDDDSGAAADYLEDVAIRDADGRILAEADGLQMWIGREHLHLPGDAAAAATLDRYAGRMARALATVINLLDPDVIVLGTIGSAFPDLFIPPAREIVRAEALAMSFSRVDLVPSGLQDRGILSALAVARRALEDHE